MPNDSKQDPLLGPLTVERRGDKLVSGPLPIPFLRGHRCKFVLHSLDPGAEDVRAAVARLFAAGGELLRAFEPYVVQYRQDTLKMRGEQPGPGADPADDVWKQVQLGSAIHVSRRERGDAQDGIYFSLSCDCDWEEEHGLQLVLRAGDIVAKVGPYDGHLTQRDAYDKASLIGVIYRA